MIDFTYYTILEDENTYYDLLKIFEKDSDRINFGKSNIAVKLKQIIPLMVIGLFLLAIAADAVA